MDIAIFLQEDGAMRYLRDWEKYQENLRSESESTGPIPHTGVSSDIIESGGGGQPPQKHSRGAAPAMALAANPMMLSSMSTPGKQAYKDAVLCLDGGGIRGLVTLVLLDKIETLSGKKITEMFDWIVGTSTGGILALALAQGIYPYCRPALLFPYFQKRLTYLQNWLVFG